VNTFNRLIDDANRRLEANEKMMDLKSHLDRLSSSQETFRRKVDTDEWEKIYTERFLNYKNEKTQSVEQKKRQQLEESIEKENKILNYVKKKTKKVSENKIQQISNRLYEESQRRNIIRDDKILNFHKNSKIEKNISKREASNPKNSNSVKFNLGNNQLELKSGLSQYSKTSKTSKISKISKPFETSKTNKKNSNQTKKIDSKRIRTISPLQQCDKPSVVYNNFAKNNYERSNKLAYDKKQKTNSKNEYFHTYTNSTITTPKSNNYLIEPNNTIFKKQNPIKIQDKNSLLSLNSFEKIDCDYDSLPNELYFLQTSSSRDFTNLNTFSNIKFVSNLKNDTIRELINTNRNKFSSNGKLSNRKSASLKFGDFNSQYIPDKTADLIVKNILKNKL
jgi:hypothetical protein